MKRKPTSTGMNRTASEAAPARTARSAQGAQEGSPSSGADFMKRHADVHRQYLDGLEPVGTMPPPTSVKGAAKTAMKALQGKSANVLLDRIGERLAFERTGTRLYDGLLLKFDLFGSWEGGPTRERLRQFRDEELAHFHLLCGAMERLGGDPTAMTPSADVAATQSLGIEKVIMDVRTTLPQAIEAILTAELVDHDGWSVLIELAEGFGQTELASAFRKANDEEAVHLRDVRQWVKAHTLAASGAAPVG